MPVVQYAPRPVFPRLGRQTTSRSPSLSPPPTPNLGLAPPAVECIRPQNGSSAAAVAHGEKPDRQSSCWAETGQGHPQNDIYHQYLLKHYSVPLLLDHSGSGVLYINSGRCIARKLSKKANRFINFHSFRIKSEQSIFTTM